VEMGIGRGRGNIREGSGEESRRAYREMRGQTRTSERWNNQALSLSAIQPKQKRRLPQPLEEEDEEDLGGSV